MAMNLSGGIPDYVRSGQSLQKGSTPGKKVDFVNQSTLGSTSFTIASGASHALQLLLTLWPDDLPADNRVADVILS